MATRRRRRVKDPNYAAKVWCDPTQPLPFTRVSIEDVFADAVTEYEKKYQMKVPLEQLVSVTRKIDALKAHYQEKLAKRQMGFGFCGIGEG